MARANVKAKDNRANSGAGDVLAKPIVRHRKSPLGVVWGFIMWLVGVLVSLAVGFGMIGNTLTIPFLPSAITIIAGWIVVVLSLLGVLFKLIDLAANV